jgi:hypothetical protein
VYKGDIDLAMADCVVLANSGDHLLGRGILVEQILGMAIESLADGQMLRALGRPTLSLSVLQDIQQQWQEHLDRNGSGINFDGEKLVWYDYIQRTFTDGGAGGGHALARGLLHSASAARNEALWRILTLRFPTRREAVADTERYYSRIRQLLAQTPWQSRREGIDANNWCQSLRWGLASVMKNRACYMMVERSWMVRTYGNAVLTTLALKRYRMERGYYPDKLEEIVGAGYLREIPRDPYAPGPLSYRKTGDDFLLYSWGTNYQDDGGKQSVDNSGRPKLFTENGDWVFWPIVRAQK